MKCKASIITSHFNMPREEPCQNEAKTKEGYCLIHDAARMEQRRLKNLKKREITMERKHKLYIAYLTTKQRNNK